MKVFFKLNRLSLTHIRAEFGMNLFRFVGFVVARELIEDGPAPSAAVIVVGRRFGVQVAVGVAELEVAAVRELVEPVDLEQRPVALGEAAAAARTPAAWQGKSIYAYREQRSHLTKMLFQANSPTPFF